MPNFYCILFYFQPSSGIRSYSIQSMSDNIDEYNCLDLWKFAKTFNLDHLAQQCLKFATQNFKAIARGDDVKSLRYDELEEVLTSCCKQVCHFWIDILDQPVPWFRKQNIHAVFEMYVPCKCAWNCAFPVRMCFGMKYKKFELSTLIDWLYRVDKHNRNPPAMLCFHNSARFLNACINN